MTKIRVLVVEDSLTVRRKLVEVLGSDETFEVVGEAADGAQAIALCQSLRPDVLTMDMMLPNMNGLAATEYIMAHCPTPILIVSASSNRGEVLTTYDALAAGAVDVCEKPTGNAEPGTWERAFLTSVRIVSRVRVITHPRARLFGLSQPRELDPPAGSFPPNGSGTIDLIAVGASTGGPAALVELFSSLPSRFALPILVVMHISAAFAPSFEEWLRSQVGRSTQFAKDGEVISELGGRVRLAPADRHLAVRNGRLQLSDAPARHSCKPSVDVLFEAVARDYGPRVAACLLTGMGRDGASGLLALRKSGAATFAQDEQSCVVYGMPREAVLLGAAERVLRPQAIARAFGELAQQAVRS